MSGYTEGSWSFEPKYGSIIISSENNSAIAKIEPLLCWDEPIANARLIAAAPELLNALLMVLDDPEALQGRPRTAEVVREAIAKATEV